MTRTTNSAVNCEHCLPRKVSLEPPRTDTIQHSILKESKFILLQRKPRRPRELLSYVNRPAEAQAIQARILTGYLGASRVATSTKSSSPTPTPCWRLTWIQGKSNGSSTRTCMIHGITPAALRI